MPTFQSAKTIGENALKTIGAFPSSMQAADPGELITAMVWLEMLLNNQTGIRAMLGAYQRIVDIPIEGNIGDYNLADYADCSEAQHVFSASIVSAQGNVNPLEMLYEGDGVKENLTDRGAPSRVVITRDPIPVLKLFPAPTQSNEDSGDVIRIRIQTYHPAINKDGTGSNDVLLRPTWYLWCTKRLSYELASGPVRRLPEGELNRIQADYERLESLLVARDGQYNSGKPPVTEPMVGWE